MAKSLPSVNTNSDTFNAWIIKTNGLVTFANTEVVSANSSANGAVTTGKGYVIGTFGANTIVATEIRGGNTIANSVLTISSNTFFTANVNRFDAGVTLGANSIVNDSSARYVAANTNVDQIADSFSSTAYRSAKYVISITDSANTKYQVTEMLLLSDGTNTYSTEYATITSNTALCTFRTDILSGSVRLLVTPAVAPIQINIAKTLLAT